MFRRQLPWVAAVVIPFGIAAGVYFSYQWQHPDPLPVRPPAQRAAHIEYTPPEPELPPSEPSSEVPILSEAARAEIEQREHALAGSRAYIMKKPLGDADTIASIVIANDTAKTRARAQRLLDSAMKLRREGVDELYLLELFGTDRYFNLIKNADQNNERTLRRLRHLLDMG